MPRDPGYTTCQYRMTAAHAKALKRLAREARTMGEGVDPESPLAILEWAVRIAGGKFGVSLPPRTANPHGGARRGPGAGREKR
jgi:hypothetical protein